MATTEVVCDRLDVQPERGAPTSSGLLPGVRQLSPTCEMPLSDLLTIAGLCRQRIEAVARPEGHVAFRMFPNGACGATSDLLARFLAERHGIRAKVASGTNVELWSHAWVVVDGVIVDITGDQFQGRPSVFVGPSDDWFASWRPSTAPYRTPHTWPEYPTLLWQAMNE